jgi:hypothetical protein
VPHLEFSDRIGESSSLLSDPLHLLSHFCSMLLI